MEHTRQANEYQSLRRVLIRGFRFLWRLRWPSLIHENDFAVWWQRGCISGWIPQKHCSSFFFFPFTAASSAFKAQPRSGKWNIPFLDIYQTGLKAGFCLTLHSSLLSTAAMSCHPRSRGIIPHQGSCKSPRHAAALSSFRASAGLTRPLWCEARSGSASTKTSSYRDRKMEPTVQHPDSRDGRRSRAYRYFTHLNH